MKLLQEQEGYQQDWASKNASKINFNQALHFFNDFFQEQEEEEIRQRRAQFEEEQKSNNRQGGHNNQQAILPMGNREKVLNEDFRSVTNMSAANKAANGNMGNNPELK